MNNMLWTKTGQVLTNQADELNRWKEYLKELLNRLSPDEPPDIPPAETPLCTNTDRTSNQEIRRAILQLKNWKAPGPDGIPPEAIKAYTETSVDCFTGSLGRSGLKKIFQRIGDMATCSSSLFLFLQTVDWIMASTIEGCQRGIKWTLS